MKTLEQIVNKVLKFKTFEKEIIIVDDCSEDNTQTIINNLISQNKEIKSIDTRETMVKERVLNLV